MSLFFNKDSGAIDTTKSSPTEFVLYEPGAIGSNPNYRFAGGADIGTLYQYYPALARLDWGEVPVNQRRAFVDITTNTAYVYLGLTPNGSEPVGAPLYFSGQNPDARRSNFSNYLKQPFIVKGPLGISKENINENFFHVATAYYNGGTLLFPYYPLWV